MCSRIIAGVASVALAAGGASGQYYQYELASPDDEGSLSIDQTFDGGFVTAGWRKVPGPDGIFNRDFYIAKHDVNGQIQWLRVWGADEDDVAFSVRQTMDGGYIVAGESRSFEPNMELILLRLDPNGRFVWAKAYPHQISGDQIHSPHPGVNLDLTMGEEIFVTGNLDGRPTLLFTDPMGFPLWHAMYFISPVPPFAEEPRIAFTDVGVDHQELSAVASGTIEYRLPDNVGLRYDVTLLKVDPGGIPLWFFTYDWPFDRDSPDMPNVAEYGHGLDIAPDGFIFASGKTDFGRPQIDEGPILLSVDPGGVPAPMMRYQPLEVNGRVLRAAPGYASVEFDNRFWTVVVAGTLTDIDTLVPNAWMMLTDPGLMPFWTFAYGDTMPTGPVWPTWGESVAVADQTCGWGLAGRAEHQAPPPFLGAGDNYLVKTEDFGVSGCLERPIDMAPEMPGFEMPYPIEPMFIGGFFELPDLVREVDGMSLQHCYYPTCWTGPCNAADLSPVWGVLDLNDVNAFVQGFVNQQPIADLNGDGIHDLIDINMFVSAFVAGCP